MAKFIQELDRVDFKNTTTEMIEVGDIVPIGKMHGVAITNIGPNSGNWLLRSSGINI